MKNSNFLSLALLFCSFSAAYCIDTEVEDTFDDIPSSEVQYRSRRGKDNHSKRNDVIIDVQQRFYKFQDATSKLKQLGHNPDQTLLQDALDVFISFIDPNFIDYEFITIQNFQFNTIQEIRDGYQFFATAVFNSFSQHFSTNVVVEPVPGTHCRSAFMTAGGGEWASLYSVTGDPANANEQLTISNWEITWVFLENGPTGPNWYINSYKEFGDRLFRFCPATGPYTLLFARQFPGSTPEPVIDFLCVNNPAPVATSSNKAPVGNPANKASVANQATKAPVVTAKPAVSNLGKRK